MLHLEELLNHRIVKARLRRGKLVENLEASTLLKTIRPAKNLIYLTDRLPKPNYQPVRYRSYFQLKDHEAPHQKYGNSMQELPNLSKSFSKSLNKSLSKSKFVS